MQETKADKIVEEILSGDYDKHIKDALIIRMQYIIKADGEFGHKPIRPKRKNEYVPHCIKPVPKVSKVEIISVDGVSITRTTK